LREERAKEPVLFEELPQIRDIYQRWMQGALCQEDALFAIGDVLKQPVPQATRADASAGREDSPSPSDG
jgi:hypothetical protein